MTWYAKELIFKATDEAWHAIEDDIAIRKHLYVLRGPIEYDWYRPENKHSYPDDGLFVIRPICSQEARAYEWFKCDDTPLNPNDILLSDIFDLEIDMAKVEANHHLSGKAFDMEMPCHILHFAKYLSQKINSTVVYYDVEFWGGAVEYELAWIFNQSEQAIINKPNIHEESFIKKITPDIESTIEGNVLRYALAKLDCQLQNGFFLPHTRSFPWIEHKVR